MPSLTIEIDDEALSEIEAAAAKRGVSPSDLTVELLHREMTRRHNAKFQHDDPLGYDTSDEDAAIRQMCDDALSGRNEDAVKAEMAVARRWFSRAG